MDLRGTIAFFNRELFMQNAIAQDWLNAKTEVPARFLPGFPMQGKRVFLC